MNPMKLIIISLICFSLIGLAQSTLLTVGNDGANYKGIQEAIDAANPGDVIEVQEGTYLGNVIVSKSLILRGIGNPMIDSNGNNSAIMLAKDGIVLEGFILMNASDSGIVITNYNNNAIVRGNTIENNHEGITIEHSFNTSIIGNTIRNNTNVGVQLQDSKLSLITNNIIYSNLGGITLRGSCKNSINGNFITNNTRHGISLGYIGLSEAGRSGFSDDNLLERNQIEYSKYGIFLTYSEGNNISFNKFVRNDYGIYAERSSNNTIENNNYAGNNQTKSTDGQSRNDRGSPLADVLMLGVTFVLANFLLGIVIGIISGLIIKKMLKYNSLGLIGDAITGIIGSIAGFYGCLVYISSSPLIAVIVATMSAFILILLVEILRRLGRSNST